MFYNINKASESLEAIEEPIFTLETKTTKLLILQCVIGYKGPVNNADNPATAYDCYKPIYFEALDGVTNAIKIDLGTQL